jgi:pimeloyl-ACP methyl ester carboxylesterase
VTGVTSKFRVQSYIGAKGVRLVADVGGDASAPSILLLHGGGQTRHSWGDAMRTLVARGYHVVNLDARGHGDSEWAPDGDYTLGTLAEDIACVIRTLSSKPALVGASMGGATALYLVGILDNLIASALVLVDIVPLIDAGGASRIAEFMNAHPNGFASLSEALDAVVAYNPHRSRHRSSSGLMKNLRKRADGRLYWHWDPRIMITRDDIEPPRQFSQLTVAAERVRIPTLLVRGLRSDLVTDEGVADLKSRIPDIEVFEVAGAGHMVAGDKNDAFNEGIFSFLRRKLPGKT